MPLSEDSILTVINRYFPLEHPSLLLGRGDDCAVLRGGGNLAVSTDIFAENAHYRRRYFSAKDIGCKSLAVNISDIAAAGAVPEGFSIGLTLSGDEDEDWISGFCKGLKHVADNFSLAVSGGDLSRASLQSVCITAWGRLPDSLPLGLRRGSAQEGDVIFTCGRLGLARAGLMLLEGSHDACELQTLKEEWPACCGAHLHPLPMARAGAALGRICAELGLQDRVGLMDVSDGLASDLPRLLARERSGLSADIALSRSMLHEEVCRYADAHDFDAPSFAFAGGEDYALVGTSPADAWPEIDKRMSGLGHELSCIGEAYRGSYDLVNGSPACESGFDHFSR
ncbi:MAG: thiamine-phosphate kinase [Mailhella sp.]|nr:thiamine-phosphate kinase [Mailhella sp.]